MSLRKNVVANYCGQFYNIIIGIVIVPFYLKYLGAEAYGLVGFFALMYSWLNLLKVGLTPAFSREVSKYHGTKSDKVHFIQLLNSIEMIFYIMGTVIVVGILTSSHWLATDWLKIEKLSPETVTYCISLMGGVAALKWFSELYVAGVQGTEEQVWLNVFIIIIASFKFIGVLFVLKYIAPDVRHFFEYHLLVGVVEVIIIARKFYKLLDIKKFTVGFYVRRMKEIAPYLGGVAYTSIVWIFLSQFDKLMLSSTLPLKEYGYFVLIALVSNGMIQMSMPISKAILPRMVKLYAQEREQEMLDIYSRYAQLIVVFISSVATILVLFPHEFLYAWSGSYEAADWASNIFIWYILGSALMTISAYQYYIQVVHGTMSLHVKYNTFTLITTVPLIYWTVGRYGAMGLALIWFGFRLLSLLIWVPYVHYRLAPGINLKWMANVFIVFVSTAFWGWLFKHMDIDFSSMSRWSGFGVLFGLGILLLALNLLTVKDVRKKIFAKVRRG